MADKTQVFLQFSDGEFDLLANYRIKIIDIKIGMPVPKNEFSSYAGSVGKKLLTHSFDSFPITFEFDYFADNLNDLILTETELRELFNKEGEYYFIYTREPGKRYPVTVESISSTKKAYFKGNFVVSFSAYKGYAESMVTTLSNFSFEDDWQFSQGLVSEDYSYSHNTSHFTIFNAGSFEIDPRESDLRITLEGESEGNVTIFNKTTGDRFIYYPSLSTNLGQTLVLDGVIPKLNGVSCGIDTNHGLINLVEGVNEIEIQNITRVKSSWDFRFLYK
ncbi:phage tail domain-containing protein [Enterococcus faecium]|uniref:phage tail domain-containing protein n=1 Tax=Enterococcus faecium TaxID=1352 RepID=UPI001CCF86D9|nr:phage tail domain-containing protein [Enterococcus faecium]MCZ1504612.1 phage tail family protein [Enterococcus faecium]WCG16384.1 phage tail family protein [Enterococcus faecium]HAZ1088426.1 phage tail family protein [Enterococcus faecium]